MSAQRTIKAGSGRRVAVCDIGTFSGLILIASRSRNRWTVHSEEHHVVDFTRGLRDASRLSTTAIGRAVRIVRRFERLAGQYNCATGAVVCTAAVRDAANHAAVTERLREATGFRVEVLSARKEAILTAIGAEIGLRSGMATALVVDIGGGSTEVIRWVRTRPDWAGIPWGAAKATEMWRRFRPRSVVDRPEYWRTHAASVIASLPARRVNPGQRLIGVGGTIVTLAALHDDSGRIDPLRLHGRVLTRRWIARTAEYLAGLNQRDIERLVPFDRKRARVLTAGTFLWVEVLNRFDAARLTVSTRGLRWGVAARLMETGPHSSGRSGPGGF